MDFSAMLAKEKAMAKERSERSTKANHNLLPTRVLTEEDLRHGQVVPDQVYYFAEFLERDSAERLEKEIDSRKFEQLAGRKLQNYGGVPHLSGTILEPLPAFLAPLADILLACQLFPKEKPNQALVNKYEPGEGIAPHQDGPNFDARAAILSLASPAIMEFSSEDSILYRVLLEPNSLLLFKDDAYLQLKHSITFAFMQDIHEPRACCNLHLVKDKRLLESATLKREKRFSVTMRCVAKVQRRVDPENEYVEPEVLAEMERRKVWWKQAISQ